MKKKNYKVDIFKTLSAIDRGNIEYYDSLSEEEQKALSMYLLVGFLKGAESDSYVRHLMMSYYVNPYLFSLSNHKKLLYLLLCASNDIGDGYTFFKFHGNKKNKNHTTVDKIVMKHYATKDVDDVLRLLDSESLGNLLKRYGIDDINTVIKEHEKNKANHN